MPLSDLDKGEIDVVAQCLLAVVYGPFFDDIEFHTLFGVSREEAKAVAEKFPDVDEFDDVPGNNDDSWLVINNAFANLLGYPHGGGSSWSTYISVTPEKVREVYDKWR